MTAPCILCVEDEPDLLHDLASELREAGYRVIEASDGNRGLAACADGGINLVLCDVQLPGIDGMDILRQVRAAPYAHVPFVLMTAYGDVSLRAEALRLGAREVLVKPVDYDHLLELAGRLLGTAERP